MSPPGGCVAQHSLYSSFVNLLRIALAGVLTVGGAVVTGAVAKADGPGVAPAGPSPVARDLARIDELHKRRDERAAWTEQQSLVQSTLARAPNDYEVLWRAARFYFWFSDDPGLPSDERSRQGKEGWDLAEHAVTANPNRVEGHYWAAACMGNYALGLGVMKALAKGLEGKFRDQLGRAQALDGRYEHGAVEIAWGRFFDKLPWPKRDRDAAEVHLKRALEINPASLRARVYLASTYLDEDRAAEAKRLLDEVAAAPAAGRYDPPEERRAKALGVGLTPQVLAKLK
jgi:Tetratricopeptide repeat